MNCLAHCFPMADACLSPSTSGWENVCTCVCVCVWQTEICKGFRNLMFAKLYHKLYCCREGKKLIFLCKNLQLRNLYIRITKNKKDKNKPFDQFPLPYLAYVPEVNATRLSTQCYFLRTHYPIGRMCSCTMGYLCMKNVKSSNCFPYHHSTV